MREQKPSIQKIIKGISKDMGIAYIYHNWTTANQLADTIALPVMINVLPVSGSFSVNVTIKENTNCLVAFLDKTDYDFDAEENDIIVERMKGFAEDFLARLSKQDTQVHLESIPYEVVYDKLDANLTGVILQLSISCTKRICN